MTEKEFIPHPYLKTIQSKGYSWSSPSNIALIKYWGKRPVQIPENPSISFTLDACKTNTSLTLSEKTAKNDLHSFDIFFENEQKDNFKPKIESFFKRIHEYVPYIGDYHFTINTSNTFPHSSGIASSASGMSALAMCLMSFERELNPDMTDEFFMKKASFLARLGSGSASRSIEGELVVWGEHQAIPGSSDLFGIKYPHEVHEVFKSYHDTILLVDKGEKQVSSTMGHQLMHNHPFADKRFDQAYTHVSDLISILKNGDLQGFIELVESEALTLHAMMLTSRPYFVLMKPNTLEIINRIWEFRKETGLHLCFTLDAGSNVHLLYPEHQSTQVYEFIKRDLVAFCQNGHYICDRIGFGAKQLPI
ncbi:MAG: diphosphomevalonate decarboxylase [Flavobacteriaceae bacterium]|nr:diphosphomevalonate decarboxylase [Flavobacteriaceae bacterium]